MDGHVLWRISYQQRSLQQVLSITDDTSNLTLSLFTIIVTTIHSFGEIQSDQFTKQVHLFILLIEQKGYSPHSPHHVPQDHAGNHDSQGPSQVYETPNLVQVDPSLRVDISPDPLILSNFGSGSDSRQPYPNCWTCR